MKVIFGALTATVFLSGCVVTSPYPSGGLIYSDLKGPNHAVIAKTAGTKHGEACASSVFGIAGWGDASIAAAKKNGQISEISAVDYNFFNVVLGAYTKTCTLVSGD